MERTPHEGDRLPDDEPREGRGEPVIDDADESQSEDVRDAEKDVAGKLGAIGSGRSG